MSLKHSHFIWKCIWECIFVSLFIELYITDLFKKKLFNSNKFKFETFYLIYYLIDIYILYIISILYLYAQVFEVFFLYVCTNIFQNNFWIILKLWYPIKGYKKVNKGQSIRLVALLSGSLNQPATAFHWKP